MDATAHQSKYSDDLVANAILIRARKLIGLCPHKRDVSALGPMPMIPRVRLSWFSLPLITGLTWPFCLMVSFNGAAQESPLAESPTDVQMQTWNWHAQNTDIEQGDWGFPAKYSGPNSLNSKGQQQETVTLDLFAGVRLWRGAEAHVNGLMWQGFGLSKTFGIEAFPNSDAYKLGTEIPYLMFAHLFIRQTIGLGGEQGVDELTLVPTAPFCTIGEWR